MKVDFEEVKKRSKKMIANFVDTLGMDGKYYANTMTTPIVYGDYGAFTYEKPGKFFQPGEKLKAILDSPIFPLKLSPETKEKIMKKGLILINEIDEPEEFGELNVTVIHETFHSKRNILYTYESEEPEYADFSQDILKGHIDESALSDDYPKEYAIDGKIQKQTDVDEALVEIMSILSYKLYKCKEEAKDTDLWDMLEQIREKYEDSKIETMCDLILKHHDLKLFNWMIDPIGYTQGDIHYDFFDKYTKNDIELLEEFYERANNERDDSIDEMENIFMDIFSNNINKNSNKDIDDDHEER